MKYKFLPLFAVILLMVIAPTPDVFGALSGSTAVSSVTGESIRGLGFYQDKLVPSGNFATTNGNYYSWTQVNGVNSDLMFGKTVDNTMGTPVVVDSTTGGFSYEFRNIAIFVAGTTVDIFTEKEVGGGSPTHNVIHTRSTDDGATWSTPVVIFNQQVNGIWYDVDGNDLSVFYKNGLGGGVPPNSENNVFYEHSSNGGTSFVSVLIDNQTATMGSSAFSQGNLVVKEIGNTVWLMYEGLDVIGGDNDIFTRYSADNGVSFTAPLIVSNTQDVGDDLKNHIFVNGTDVTLVYNGQGGSPTDYLSLVRSSNSGVSYSAQQDIELGIICDWFEGGINHFVSEDNGVITAICLGLAGNGVFKNESLDMGATWGTWDQLADDVAFTSETRANTKIVGSQIYYLWESTDNLAPFDSAYNFKTSNDTGTTVSTLQTFQTNDTGFFTNISAFGNNVWITLKNASNNIIQFFESFAPANTIPVVTLVGSTPQQVEADSVYSDLGATCFDAEDGQIDGNVVIGGQTVNTAITGSYIVDYDCDDSFPASAITVQRTVNVVDTVIPVVTLVGSTPTLNALGVAYVEQGATCFDDHDGQIDGNVVVGGQAVNVNLAGDYIVDYDCDDAGTNSALTVQRTVTVLPDTTAPSMALLGGSTVTVTLDGTYLEAGVLGVDDVDGDISGDVVITGSVNTAIRGSTILTYDLQDNAGNNAPTLERTVVVQKPSGGGGSFTGTGSGGTTTVETLDDVPTSPTTQPTTTTDTPLLSFQDGEMVSGDGVSIADLFRNLFSGRLDSSTGETVQTNIGQQVADTVSSFTNPQSSQSGTPSQTGFNIVNAISDFFGGLFG